MAKANGQELPFLVAGGGSGGLVTAYALARKGFPVRLFEQAPEFKELGAGIQLGPDIFRAIERIGLKADMLDDAWVPPSLEMRDALTGEEITSIPLGEPFRKRFGQPYAGTHRADIHGVYVRGCERLGCDGMCARIRDKVIGDGAPRVSGHIAYRAVLKRAEVPDDLWRPG